MKPIIFNAESVRAILDGRKTQTRRVVPAFPFSDDWKHWNGRPEWERRDCPFGQPGDTLWVRETFLVQPELWAAGHSPQPVHYASDTPRNQAEDYALKPSIHMPRWASRITLKITDIRVERLQDISTDDAAREGITYAPGSYELEWMTPYQRERKRLADFQAMWDTINAKRGYPWESNPYVWVLEFSRDAA